MSQGGCIFEPYQVSAQYTEVIRFFGVSMSEDKDYTQPSESLYSE